MAGSASASWALRVLSSTSSLRLIVRHKRGREINATVTNRLSGAKPQVSATKVVLVAFEKPFPLCVTHWAARVSSGGDQKEEEEAALTLLPVCFLVLSLSLSLQFLRFLFHYSRSE